MTALHIFFETELKIICTHVLNWGREHSAFPVHWSGILSLSHCGLLIVSQIFVAGLRLTFLTSTYRDFIFTLLVFSIIVDICTATDFGAGHVTLFGVG